MRRRIQERPRYVWSRITMRPEGCGPPIRTIPAFLRLIFWGLVMGYCGERCWDCGRPYGRGPAGMLWWAGLDGDSALWQAVTGWTCGCLCPSCFQRQASRSGVVIQWRAEQAN